MQGPSGCGYLKPEIRAGESEFCGLVVASLHTVQLIAEFCRSGTNTDRHEPEQAAFKKKPQIGSYCIP
jgi:hypothetical protein